MGTQNKTAFIIEDDKDICSLLSIFLKSQNIEVFKAHSLAKAKSLALDLKPALIFVDHRLPDGYGFSYIGELKNKFPKALIVAMTAQNSPELRESIMNNGITHYLEKPFRINELKELINNLSC
jgi:DNA-binding response OmpR family regulator